MTSKEKNNFFQKAAEINKPSDLLFEKKNNSFEIADDSAPNKNGKIRNQSDEPKRKRKLNAYTYFIKENSKEVCKSLKG